ncbi:hypothetical protein H0H92_015247 [Tricholoma furcatifolium]|nr:hypothetical protein H0H92_015247 [Tricholoma furcatifolium]
MLGSSRRIIALAAVFLLFALNPVLALPVQTGVEPSPAHHTNSKSPQLHDGAKAVAGADLRVHDQSPSAVQEGYNNDPRRDAESVGRRSVDAMENALQERQYAQAVKAVVEGVKDIVNLIKGIIAKIKAKRAKKKAEKECIKQWVDSGRKAHPDWNWLVVHTGKTRPGWKSGLKEGTDYSHVVDTCDIPGGKQATYDVYTGPHLQGDFYNDGGRGGTDWHLPQPASGIIMRHVHRHSHGVAVALGYFRAMGMKR